MSGARKAMLAIAVLAQGLFIYSVVYGESIGAGLVAASLAVVVALMILSAIDRAKKPTDDGG